MDLKNSGFVSVFLDIIIVFLLLIYVFSMAVRLGELLAGSFTWPQDFCTYYFSGIALSRGLDIYKLSDLRGVASSMGYNIPFDEYVYPPLLAVLSYPLSFMRLSHAFVLWILLNQITLVLAVWLYYRLSGKTFTGFRANLLISLLFIPSLFYGSSSGQVAILLMSLFIAFYWAVEKGMPRLAGFLLGLTTIIKPVSLVFYPHLLFKREFKTLSAAIATDAALLAFSALASGPATMKRFLEVMFNLYFSSTSFESFILRLDSTTFVAVKIFMTILFFALLYLACRKTSGGFEEIRFGLEYSFVMASIIMLTPRMQYYNYTYLIPVFWILYDKRREIFGAGKLGYVVLALFLLVVSPTAYVSLYAVISLWLFLLYLLFKTR